MTVADLLNTGTSDIPGAVIFGRIQAVTVVFDDTMFAQHEDEREGPPPGHPKADPVPPNDSSGNGIPFSHYTVVVDRVINGSGLAVGDSIDVSQLGGLIDGVVYEDPHDPVMSSGRSYLLTIWQARLGTWVSLPQGRFELDAAGRLQPVARVWEQTPAALALRGLTVDEAIRIMEAALAAQPTVPAQ